MLKSKLRVIKFLDLIAQNQEIKEKVVIAEELLSIYATIWHHSQRPFSNIQMEL